MSSNPFIEFRDLALQKIANGVTIFNQNAGNSMKQDQGYRLMVSGISDLNECKKRETNPELISILKKKIEEQINQATLMKKEIENVRIQENKIAQTKSSFGYLQNYANQTANTIPVPAPGNNPQRQNPQQQNDVNHSNDNQKNIQKNIVQPKNDNQNNQPPSQDSKPSTNNGQDQSKIKEVDKESQKFENALKEAIVSEKPNVRWSDVAGLESAKKALNEAVILPIRFPHIFKGMIKPWKGILLYGPPGTGKTFLAKACATECDATFFSISSSDLISKWVGESEKLIRTLFKMAREKKPSVIFIDEIDSMTGSRSEGENDATRRVKTEFLVQMQGVGNDDTGVLVLGATNVPWGLDPAIRRRFEKRIMIPLPEQEARFCLFDNLLNKTPNSISQEDRHYLAEQSEGFSGSDISVLIRDASYEPLRIAQRATHFKKVMDKDQKMKFMACAPSDPEGFPNTLMDFKGEELKLQDVSLDHFELALQKCKPSVSEKDIERQIEFTREFGESD